MEFNTFYDTITKPILTGEYDGYLDNILEDVKLRKASLAPKIWEFKAGDRVRFSDRVNPQYLRGREATITKVNRVKVVVDLDERINRFYKNITTPLSMIEKV